MKKNLALTCSLGILAIVFGAFGAHVLKNRLDSQALMSFETAVKYQMYHVIVLLFVNTFNGFSDKIKNTISYLFFVGILLFSGSIYAIHLAGVQAKKIWFITPIGGFLFITGWAFMLLSFLKINSKN